MKRILLAAMFVAVMFTSSFAQIASYDVGLRKLTTKIWARQGEQVAITGEFRNLGTEKLQTMKVNWSVDETTVHEFTMTDLNMSKGIDSSFVHGERLRVEGSEDILIKVWLSHPNGEQDEKSRNDTLFHTLQVISEFPERGILLEEFTGAWCGWCPRGPITYRDQVLPNHPNVILAALHNGDDMVCNVGNAVVSAYASSFPSGMIDRRSINDRPIALSTGDWLPALNEMDLEFTPAEINVYNYYWPDTYEWKIDVVVDFIMDYSGDLRLNCFLLEDSVTGTGAGYDQMNSYNSRTDIPELRGAGNPIVGYKHNHVVCNMIGGAWGQTGIIPKNVKRGDRYIYSRTIKPPVGSDIRNMHLVGVLQAYSDNKSYRPILNAKKVEVHLATGFEWSDVATSVKTFPNPVVDQVFVELNSSLAVASAIEVYTLAGQLIYSNNIPTQNGMNIHQIDASDWNAGMYLLKVTQGKHSTQSKIIKQ